MLSIKINPTDLAAVKQTLNQLSGDEADLAMVRGINKTMTGVRTDGTKILYDRYALTATVIRESFKIRKAYFRDPNGSVSTKGTFIRLIKFGARAVSTGVSVKVLRTEPRKTVAHAFIAKLGLQDQVYRRAYKGPHKKPVATRKYAAMPFEYRFPVHALYGPRIQDHLDDPVVIGTLQNMAGTRLTDSMRHEVEYLLSKAG
jgi:hypothetical protein